jgi:hypothetical protein
MKTIYKYPIEITDEQEIKPPQFAKPLHVGLDPQGQPCIWLEVDTENDPKTMRIYVIGTGNPLPEYTAFHAGSFVQSPFVWHVYTS